MWTWIRGLLLDMRPECQNAALFCIPATQISFRAVIGPSGFRSQLSALCRDLARFFLREELPRTCFAARREPSTQSNTFVAPAPLSSKPQPSTPRFRRQLPLRIDLRNTIRLRPSIQLPSWRGGTPHRTLLAPPVCLLLRLVCAFGRRPVVHQLLLARRGVEFSAQGEVLASLPGKEEQCGD